jgi:serine/threonine protein kinase/tetratricopeptide (TPR) repeat protein
MIEEFEDKQKAILEAAVAQFVDEQLQGREPDIDEFVKKYPGLEDHVKKRIQKLQRIDTLFSSLVNTDESEFENIIDEHDIVGKKVGSFEIVKIIGRGGMGVVYLARDIKLKRSVAIKSIPAVLASSSIARKRFRREAELLASLNHPNIAVIHDIIEQEDHSGYLVLEYIEGVTLAECIAGGQLSIKEALSISQQVAEAISAAHKKGIVHRDLKPGNIKITPDGRVKVLDFGLAKASGAEDKKTETTETQHGRVIGTPAYMSPEQARGKETDHHSDIWSFGCIMYQMLTGQLPFDGETATDTLARIIERQPDWNLLPKDSPAKIRTLLCRCLEKDPDKRLEDIADAAAEINETLNKQPQPLPVRLRKIVVTICVTIVVTLFGVAIWFAITSSKDIRLVVLPFENLGPAEEEYFSDGITEEIMSRLSAIHTLDVISRTSSMQYKNTNKTIQEIGKELDVEYVLEGTVRWERLPEGSDRVRVTPQLIRVSDDTHLWSERYDAVLANIIQVQSDMAEQITRALDITLFEREQQALVYKPTENTEAHLYYMQGNKYYHRRYDKSDLSNAIQMYKMAIELDPNFAQAYSQLSRAHIMIFYHYDHNDSRLVLAKEAVEEALRLNPDLPEAHLALGQYYHQGLQDYDLAYKELEIARKIQPINSEVLYFTGLVQGRQGKFEQALANIKGAYELDPLSNNIAIEIGLHYMFLRKYPEAETYCKRAIFLAPDSLNAYNLMAQIYTRRDGNTKKAREILQEAIKNAKGAEDPEIIQSLVNLDIYDRNYQAALDSLSLLSKDVDEAGFDFPKALRFALIYEYMNNKDRALKYNNNARISLESKIDENPEDPQFHSLLGITYAGLGDEEKAIREGKSSVVIRPVSKDTIHGTFLVKNLALIYCMVGKYDLAIDKLEYLLSIPGELSIPLLKIDPAWDPLRHHPRFKELIEHGKY